MLAKRSLLTNAILLATLSFSAAAAACFKALLFTSAATTDFTSFFFAAAIACIPLPVPMSRTLPKAYFPTASASRWLSSAGSEYFFIVAAVEADIFINSILILGYCPSEFHSFSLLRQEGRRLRTWQ